MVCETSDGAFLVASPVAGNIGRTGPLPVDEDGELDVMVRARHEPGIQRSVVIGKGLQLNGEVGSSHALDETVTHGCLRGRIRYSGVLVSVVVIADVLLRRRAIDENLDTQAHVFENDHDGSGVKDFSSSLSGAGELGDQDLCTVRVEDGLGFSGCQVTRWIESMTRAFPLPLGRYHPPPTKMTWGPLRLPQEYPRYLGT